MKRSIIFLTLTSLTTLNGLADSHDSSSTELTAQQRENIINYRLQDNQSISNAINGCYNQQQDGNETRFCQSLLQAYNSELKDDETRAVSTYRHNTIFYYPYTTMNAINGCYNQQQDGNETPFCQSLLNVWNSKINSDETSQVNTMPSCN